MRRYFGAAAVVVFLMALALVIWGGGRDIFESPISSIPSILIDRSDNETEIFVHGMNDFKYTSMSLVVTSGNTTYERTRDDTYFIYYNSSAENFTVNISVLNKNKKYEFNGNILVADPSDTSKVLTLNEERKDKVNTYTLTAANLPWKKFMERVR